MSRIIMESGIKYTSVELEKDPYEDLFGIITLKKEDYEILEVPIVIKKKPCKKCHGLRILTCPGCRGSCQSHDEETCMVCHGKGEVDCYRCEE